ncbi:hypothetical protein OEA41_002482 [Lepraria neglecta]|uniref:Succinate dehydrogenase assembly factor 3 n=1 Tax=Lepraria neglecta TaxID=209136 RepID=A0AAD9ZC34_9LECA|nr:hypothetical protein OEA41_002482 [Lepraria neglecta]
MRPSLRLLATPTTVGSTKGLKPAPLALLPPIPLYRRLLRTHRKHLDPRMRLLGDEYVKSEFRAHKNVENPMHIIGFLTEWQMYAQKIEGDEWLGEKLDKGKIDKMSDQQLGQMYELMQAIRKQGQEGGEEDVEITDPCAKDRNFGNCPKFHDGTALNPANHPRTNAEEGQCPKCDEGGEYAGDKIRMVKGVQTGYRFGLGLNESDCGVDLLRPKELYRTRKKKEVEFGFCTVM